MTDFAAPLLAKGWTRNKCLPHCPDHGSDDHAHLRAPGGGHEDDVIIWANGQWSGYDLTQPARIIYPAAPGRFRRS
jgi:hypothetical protein